MYHLCVSSVTIKPCSRISSLCVGRARDGPCGLDLELDLYCGLQEHDVKSSAVVFLSVMLCLMWCFCVSWCLLHRPGQALCRSCLQSSRAPSSSCRSRRTPPTTRGRSPLSLPRWPPASVSCTAASCWRWSQSPPPRPSLRLSRYSLGLLLLQQTYKHCVLMYCDESI